MRLPTLDTRTATVKMAATGCLMAARGHPMNAQQRLSARLRIFPLSRDPLLLPTARARPVDALGTPPRRVDSSRPGSGSLRHGTGLPSPRGLIPSTARHPLPQRTSISVRHREAPGRQNSRSGPLVVGTSVPPSRVLCDAAAADGPVARLLQSGRPEVTASERSRCSLPTLTCLRRTFREFDHARSGASSTAARTHQQRSHSSVLAKDRYRLTFVHQAEEGPGISASRRGLSKSCAAPTALDGPAVPHAFVVVVLLRGSVIGWGCVWARPAG